MSSETLYRKYRSKDFSELLGQDHITKTLLNSIKKGTFAHAYLLTGPRGVGKTSAARLFAYKINGIEYSTNETYSDIIEIDAASNRRIDEIRELRDKVNIAPSALKYKVYIIDEVHMLTKEAFNALLKTLEEPPEHAIFILATTDLHKVPDTIKSRCIRFTFSSIPSSSIKKHLSKIAKKESIDIEEAALDIISDNAEGSFRDAISLLDQFRNSEKVVKADYVAKTLGMSPEKEISGLLSFAASSNPQKVVEVLDRLREAGATDSQIAKQLIAKLRESLLGTSAEIFSNAEAIKLINSLLKIENYNNKKIALEIALIEMSAESSDGVPSEVEPPKTKSANTVKPSEPHDTQSNNSVVEQPKLNQASNMDFWERVLLELKSKHNTLYAIARMAEPMKDGDSLELHFKFPFHYKQMKLEKNHLQLEKVVKSADKKITKISLVQSKTKETKPDVNEKDQPVENISNIFGPSEVLES